MVLRRKSANVALLAEEEEAWGILLSLTSGKADRTAAQHKKRREERKKLQHRIDENFGMPKVSGWLRQTNHSLWFGEEEKMRWVELNPRLGTLVIQSRDPSQEKPKMRFLPGLLNGGKPDVRVYHIEHILTYDRNEKWFRIFLRFDGHSSVVNLAASDAAQYKKWVEAFSMFDPPQA